MGAPKTIDGLLSIAPLVGLPAGNFVPADLRAQAAVVATRNKPAGATSDFETVCTAFVIARGLIYYKKVPGDCGSYSLPDFGNAQLTQGAGMAAGSAISAIARVSSGVASIAGAVLPGIQVAVEAITQIFQHHAQAVYTEQQTICSVASVINQVFAYYDNQVRLGNISPATAYTGMQNYLYQVIGKLSTIEKKCNAACQYIGMLKAHAEFCQTYYPAIAPVSFHSHAPGAPPANDGTTPGGVITVGSVLSPITSVLSSVGGAIESLLPSTPSIPSTPAQPAGAPGFASGNKLILVGLFAGVLVVLAIGASE